MHKTTPNLLNENSRMFHMCVILEAQKLCVLLQYHDEPHNRDNKGVGVACKIKPPKSQPQMAIGQYLTKPKQAFRSTRNSFKSYYFI